MTEQRLSIIKGHQSIWPERDGIIWDSPARDSWADSSHMKWGFEADTMPHWSLTRRLLAGLHFVTAISSTSVALADVNRGILLVPHGNSLLFWRLPASFWLTHSTVVQPKAPPKRYGMLLFQAFETLDVFGPLDALQILSRQC